MNTKRPYTVEIKDKSQGGVSIPLGEIMARGYRQAFTMTRRKYFGWFRGNETMSYIVVIKGTKKTVEYPAVTSKMEQAASGK